MDTVVATEVQAKEILNKVTQTQFKLGSQEEAQKLRAQIQELQTKIIVQKVSYDEQNAKLNTESARKVKLEFELNALQDKPLTDGQTTYLTERQQQLFESIKKKDVQIDSIMATIVAAEAERDLTTTAMQTAQKEV